jgi:hypothetical protein
MFQASQGAAPVMSPAGGGDVGSPGGWHPTIIYLIVLLLAESIVVAFLSRQVLR